MHKLEDTIRKLKIKTIGHSIKIELYEYLHYYTIRCECCHIHLTCNNVENHIKTKTHILKLEKWNKKQKEIFEGLEKVRKYNKEKREYDNMVKEMVKLKQ